MAAPFNLTAQINLQGPTNLKPIVSKIKRELGSITTDINIDIKASAARNIGNITSRLKSLSVAAKDANNNVVGLNQSLSQLASGFNSLSSATSSSVSTVNNNNAALTSAKKTIQQTRSEIEEFGKQSGLAIRRFAAFSTVTSVVYGLANAFTSAFKEFVVFNKEIVRLSQVTNKSVGDLKGVSDEITKLSTGLGVASSDLLEVSVTLAQAGLSAADTQTALEALAKSALAPSFESLKDTTEGSIAVLRQFGLQANELESALGSINAVAAAFAVESSDLITAIQRTGGVFASASKGVSTGTESLNEFLAIFTSVRATTRESAETIATGLRTIFTRIQRGDTIDALKQYGVVLTDLEGKFVGPFEAVKRLSDGLNQLDPRDIRFSQIVEELGGFRQIGKVIPLIQQFAVAQEALKVAQKGQGSLAQDAITAQQSLAVQFTKTRENFLALVREIGDSTTFKALTNITFTLTNGLINLTRALEPLLPLLLTFTAIKLGSGLTQFASGFSKGLGGGGAGAVPAIPGGPVGGAGGAAAAASSATSSVASNTAAIANLTTNIATLITTANALNTTIVQNNNLLASRPRTRGFARGGFVPGSGNRDTVPAMLTPGEFVISKPAVQAMGASNLSGINKYAAGGIVKYIKDGNKQVGAAVLEPGGTSTQDISLTRKKLEKAVGFPIDPSKLPSLRGIKGIVEGLSNNTSAIFNESLNNGIIRGVNLAAKQVSGELGLPFTKIPKDGEAITKFLNGINSGTRGNMFEDVLYAMRESPGPFSTREKGQNFDFPNGLPSLTADDYQNLPNAWIDAKASFDAASARRQGSLQNKTFREFVKEIGSDQAYYEGQKNIKQAVKSKVVSYAGQDIDSPAVKARLAELGLEGASHKELQDIRRYLATGDIPSRGIAKNRVEQFIGERKNLATGGSISGSDTVPALLTPGEFVVNKSSAQSIGYSNLHKMNKMRGYNKGGIVGGIQRFAAGGAVSGLDMLAIGSILTATLQPAVEKLAASFVKLDSNVSSFGTSISGAIKESTSLISSAAIGLSVTGAGGKTRGAAIAGGGLFGAVGGFLEAGSARNLELALKENAKALSNFDKLVQDAASATDDKDKIEASKKVSDAFTDLAATFDKNNSVIDNSDKWKAIGTAISNSTTTFLTLTTSLSALSLAIQTNTAATQTNTGAKGVGAVSNAFTGMGGAMGAAAQTTAQAQAASGALGPMAKFGIGLAKITGTIATAASGIGLFISVIQLGYSLFTIWNSSVKKSTDETLKFADALKKATESSAENSLANARYTNVVIENYDALLRQKATGNISEEQFYRAIGGITSGRGMVRGTSVQTSVFGQDETRFISDTNLMFREMFRANLENAGIFLDINKNIGEFINELKSTGQTENLNITNRVLGETLSKFIQQQFIAAKVAGGSNQDQAMAEFISLTQKGSAGYSEAIKVVEIYTGKINALNLAQDSAALAAKQLQLSFVGLREIVDNFSASTSRFVSELEASSQDIDNSLSVLQRQPRIVADPNISRRSRILNNITGSSAIEVQQAIKDTFASIDPSDILAPELKKDFSKLASETESLILAYRVAKRELPTLLSEFANLPVQDRNIKPIEDRINKLFDNIQFDENIKINDSIKRRFVEAITSSITSAAAANQPITNFDELLAKFPALGQAIEDSKKILIDSNEKQAKISELAAAKANQLAESLSRLNDIEINRAKIISDIGTRANPGLEIRKALGDSIKAADLNASFDSELKAITDGLVNAIDAGSIGRELMVQQQGLALMQKSGADLGVMGETSSKIQRLNKALNLITDSGTRLKIALDDLSEKEKDLFQTPQRLLEDLILDDEKRRKFLTAQRVAEGAMANPNARLGQSQIKILTEYGRDLRGLGRTSEADALLKRIVPALEKELTPQQAKFFPPDFIKALMATTSKEKISTGFLDQVVNNATMAAKEVLSGLGTQKTIEQQQISILEGYVKNYNNQIAQLQSILAAEIKARAHSLKLMAPDTQQKANVQNRTSVQMAQATIDNIMRNIELQGIQRSGYEAFQTLPKTYRNPGLTTKSFATPTDAIKALEDLKVQLQNPDLVKPGTFGKIPILELLPGGYGGDITNVTKPLIEQIDATIRQITDQIKEQQKGAQGATGLPGATGNQGASLFQKPLQQFVSYFEKSLSDGASLFSTKIVDDFGTKLAGFSTSVDKLGNVTKTFIDGLNKFNETGIKGPNIPEEVTVALSFDEKLVVNAERSNNNETLLAQIGILVEETIKKELTSLKVFG